MQPSPETARSPGRSILADTSFTDTRSEWTTALKLEQLSLNGLEGRAAVSSNGRAVFVDGRKLLQELYLEFHKAAINEAPQRNVFEVARSVDAFYHRTLDVLFVPLPQAQSPSERIWLLSLIRHEDAHSKGADEAEAWQAQAEYLNRNGYEMRFLGANFVVVKPRSRVPRPSRPAEIEHYIAKVYAVQQT